MSSNLVSAFFKWMLHWPLVSRRLANVQGPLNLTPQPVCEKPMAQELNTWKLMLVNWPQKPISRQFVDQITETETVQARIEKKGREVWGGGERRGPPSSPLPPASSDIFLTQISCICIIYLPNENRCLHWQSDVLQGVHLRNTIVIKDQRSCGSRRISVDVFAFQSGELKEKKKEISNKKKKKSINQRARSLINRLLFAD